MGPQSGISSNRTEVPIEWDLKECFTWAPVEVGIVMKENSFENEMDISPQRFFAMSMFVKVWTYLHRLDTVKCTFALKWLWKNELLLVVFINEILGLEVTGLSKGLLYNGYITCQTFHRSVFSKSVWAKIDPVFKKDSCIEMHLPRSLFTILKQVRDLWENNLRSFLAERNRTSMQETQISKEDISISLLDLAVYSEVSDCFLSDWSIHGMEMVHEDALPLCHMTPSCFVTIEKKKNFTFFYDRSSEEAMLIAVILEQQLLSLQAEDLIRNMMADLFNAHNGILRTSTASLNSRMVGHGPLYYRFAKDGGNKISFYTHPAKLEKALKVADIGYQFDILTDRYAHATLVDIIITMYASCCPELLDSFFDFGPPYLGPDQYEQTDLERRTNGRGPCAYQLFVTHDYCSQIHVDPDFSSFTLRYASHPDSSTRSPQPVQSPTYFIIAPYGIPIPVGNTNLLAFRAAIGHGSEYRRPSAHSVYVAGVTITSSLNNLMKRRIQQF